MRENAAEFESRNEPDNAYTQSFDKKEATASKGDYIDFEEVK